MSFDRLDVDGSMSTNDTVLVLASGASGVPADPAGFTAALTAVCRDLARQMQADAEGVTKRVTVRVTGAATDGEAVVLARSGVMSLLPNHVIATQGFHADESPLNTQQIDVLVQQVINLRRGADLLLARKDVDPKRLAYVGHSCDGSVAGLLGGIDKRFKALVVMAGSLSDVEDVKNQRYQEYRKQVGAARFDTFIETYSWTDPGKYISHSEGIPKLLQFANDEPFLNPEQARRYLPYVSEPKVVHFYDAPHALNAEATRDRINFLSDELKFPKPTPTLVASIPLLKQPPWPKQEAQSSGSKKKKH